jgi:Domain of unknown function (DUF6864)
MIDTNQQNNIVTSYSGNLKVIGNGISPATKEFPLKLKVRDLEIEFEFTDDKSNETVEERRIVGKKLFLVLKNFNNSLGTGVVNPVKFGFIDKKEIFLSYWVWTPNIKDGKRIINWTILQSEEEMKTEE